MRFAGDVDDLPAALSLADVVVLPATRPDPSGVLAAAAQAMGKPVIVTNQGALAESVMPAATGWLVPPDDPGELARAMRARPGDGGRTSGGGSRLGRAPSSSSEFGMERMCERTLAVYRELVEPARWRLEARRPRARLDSGARLPLLQAGPLPHLPDGHAPSRHLVQARVS